MLNSRYDGDGILRGTRKRELAAEYMSGSERVRVLYPFDARDLESWRRIMDARVGARLRREGICAVLKVQNERFGCGVETFAGIERLGQGGTVVVATGQQVGLLTGPLYTMYKALTAIRLARRVEEQYGCPTVPLFWMGSNDHDLEEVNHVDLAVGDDRVETLTYRPSPAFLGQPMSRVPVEAPFEEFIGEFEQYLPDSAFKANLFEPIRASYSIGSTLSEGFGRMMAGLLHTYGLILLDPSDPELKRLMAPIFEVEIQHPLRSTALLNEAAGLLSSMGYTPQVEKTEDSTSLFFFDEEGLRRKLLFRDGGYQVEGMDLRMGPEELLAVLERAPERLDPNVALRPVVQDALLPTVAYVAGPGEIAYFAQLRAVYEFFGVQMPIFFPRARFVLVERKIQRIMDKYGLSVEDLSVGPDELFGRLVRDRFPEDLEQLFRDSTEDIGAILDRLGGPLTAFDPTLSGLVDSTKGRVAHQVNVLRNKALQAQRRASETLRGQIGRACAHIQPLGRPQERTFNIVPYLVSYGPDLIPRLMDVLDLDRWELQIVEP